MRKETRQVEAWGTKAGDALEVTKLRKFSGEAKR